MTKLVQIQAVDNWLSIFEGQDGEILVDPIAFFGVLCEEDGFAYVEGFVSGDDVFVNAGKIENFLGYAHREDRRRIDAFAKEVRERFQAK